MSPPLSELYTRTLDKAARASKLPTIDDETQELIQATLSDLSRLTSRVVSLSLFSANEVLDDISTPDLVYLSLPFIYAEVQNRIRTTEVNDRMNNLALVQRHLNAYVFNLETYDIIPETDRVLHSQPSSSIRDVAKRRVVKIRQHTAEKDLRTRIEVIRRRRRQTATEDYSLTNFDLVAFLLLPSENEEDVETENILRETTLLLLRLFYAQACTQLEGADQEIQLLRNAPPPSPSKPPVDERRNRTRNEDAWKIDTTCTVSNSGPLLDPHGKPLRPFTILPAGASDRTRLHAQVFRPDHRLPTMAIDEYLEIERQRGGILSGGGPQSEAKPTSSEQLTVHSEMDGSVLGELKAEEKRHEDEQWAQYKDTHPRGAGNTMNRG